MQLKQGQRTLLLAFEDMPDILKLETRDMQTCAIAKCIYD